MLMGLAIYRWNMNEILVSAAAVFLAYALIWVGYHYPLAFPERWGEHTVVCIVKSFIMTTLDSGTRLARFIVTESLGTRVPVFKNNIVATLAALIPAFYLAVSNSYKTIWGMFGKSNQVIAAVALITLTLYLARNAKNVCDTPSYRPHLWPSPQPPPFSGICLRGKTGSLPRKTLIGPWA